MENFRKLRVWQSAKEIAVKTYLLTRESELSKDFGLKDQILRAAVSIASNIAEGDELGSDRQSVKHFYIAKGSIAELITQIIIANEIGYLSAENADEVINDCDKIAAMLTKLIRARRN